MPADLGFEEILVIHDAIGAPPAPDAAATERAAPPTQDPEVEQARVILRFGDRVEIRAGGTARTGARLPRLSNALLASLSETERFGVEALRLRTSAEFEATKAARPRHGERW